MKTNEELAMIGYDAYAQSANGLNYLGKPMPAWANLPFAIQTNWITAATVIKMATQMAPAGVS